jgi:hypothetical protein
VRPAAGLWLAAALGLAVAGRAAPAAADDAVPLPDQPAALRLGAPWIVEPAPAVADAPLLVMRHPGGAVLAVTVAMVPNPDAWRERTRAAYLARIVEGFAAEPGVTVVSSASRKSAGVPTLDLVLERRTAEGRRSVAVRLLVFRSRTIAVAVEGRRAAELTAAARALVPTIDATATTRR